MHMETGTTRRSFLVGTGVALGTAVGAVALGGCSSKDASSGDQDLASTGVDLPAWPPQSRWALRATAPHAFSWKRATVRSAAAIALSRAA